MLDNCIIYPKELTSSMRKYKERFYEKARKSGQLRPSLEKDIDKHHIIEWDDGWAQFNVTENTIVVRTLFSEKGTSIKFDYLYALAKSLNKREIVFETERSPKAWVKLINNAAKKLKRPSRALLKGYIIGIKI